MIIKHRDHALAINMDLVRDQRIDYDTFVAIVELHKERADLNNFIARRKDPILISLYYSQRTQIEYELQELWGFDLDANYHRSWIWSHCTCSKSDNMDSFPYAQHFNGRCLLHKSHFE